MKHRRRRPSFDALESRDLMATLVELDFVGPLEDGVFRSGGAQLLDFPGFPPVPGEINVTVQSTTQNSIGSRMNFSVTTTNSKKLASVKYEMTVGGAILSQTWNVTTADYTRFPSEGVSHSWAAGQEPFNDTFELFWDEVPQAKSVKITATFVGGGGDDWVGSWTAQAPHVDYWKAYGDQSGFGTIPGFGPFFGFYLDEDIFFTGKAWGFPANGSLTAWQTVWSHTKTTGTKKDVEITFDPLTTYLDYNQENDFGPMSSYYKDVFVTDPDPVIFGGPNAPADSPNFGVLPPTQTQQNVVKSLLQDDAFQTYLVYQPTGGIRISIAQLNWSETNSATYTGSTELAIAQAIWTDTTKWTKSLNHPTPFIATGWAHREILRWQDNSENGKVDEDNIIITTH